VWRFLRKLKIELPYDPAIPLLGIHPKNIGQDSITIFVHTPLFITDEPIKCPITDEWIKKIFLSYMENRSKR
jgi:hypothetical protein